MTDLTEIDRVLSELDTIVSECAQYGDRLGYFAAMYRRVTRRVRQGIVDGSFEDGARMVRLDAVFARHYFRALNNHRHGGYVPECWSIAFRAAQSRKSVILQHLLLGMNAHIFLDLGVAAAEVAPRHGYGALEADFNRINDILFDELDPTENKLGTLSPWVGLLDVALGDVDEWLAKRSLRWFRESAWQFGGRLAELEPAQRPPAIAERDGLAALLGGYIASPGFLERIALGIVRLVETKDVSLGIRVLS